MPRGREHGWCESNRIPHQPRKEERNHGRGLIIVLSVQAVLVDARFLVRACAIRRAIYRAVHSDGKSGRA